MTIKTDFDLGQTVYFLNDPEWKPHLVLEVTVSILGTTLYRIGNCGNYHLVYAYEITGQKTERTPATFKLEQTT